MLDCLHCALLTSDQNFYQAHGSAASWEWLEMIGPCVEVLRHLAKRMSKLLGSDQGTLHEPMDLTADIPILMTSLADHKVYEIIKGRILDDDTPTVDVISIGLQNLTDININPLDAYNKSFEHLQARRRLKPIVGVPAPLASESAVQATTDITIDPTPSQLTHAENEPADPSCTETETRPRPIS